MTDDSLDAIVRGRLGPRGEQPALSLPDGARIAVWTILNVEHWSADRAMPRMVVPPPMGQPLIPDVPNWAWHEYGMRAGFPRLFELLTSRNLPVTLAINGSACRVYADACRQAHAAGWEFMGHGFEQKPMHKVDDQAAAIAETMAAIAEITGAPPRGWESPGMTETAETLDLLKEAGLDYVCDFVMDDVPVKLTTRAGTIVSVPYTVEINDVVIFAIQQHSSDEFLKRGKAQFDRLYAEGATAPKVMGISIHPYLSGVPHRVGYLEELYDYIRGHEGVHWCTGADLCDLLPPTAGDGAAVS